MAFAAFQARLNAGPTDIQAHLVDTAGKELCGAFHLYLANLNDDQTTGGNHED